MWCTEQPLRYFTPGSARLFFMYLNMQRTMSAEKPYTTKEFLKPLEVLFDFNHPRTYEKHLLEVWNNYLIHLLKHEHPTHFTHIAQSMNHLFNFLQEAETVIGRGLEGDAY